MHYLCCVCAQIYASVRTLVHIYCWFLLSSGSALLRLTLKWSKWKSRAYFGDVVERLAKATAAHKSHPTQVIFTIFDCALSSRLYRWRRHRFSLPVFANVASKEHIAKWRNSITRPELLWGINARLKTTAEEAPANVEAYCTNVYICVHKIRRTARKAEAIATTHSNGWQRTRLACVECSRKSTKNVCAYLSGIQLDCKLDGSLIDCWLMNNWLF